MEGHEGDLQEGLRSMKSNVLEGPMIKERLMKLQEPYLELQTSKWDNLSSPGRVRRRSKTFLLTVQPIYDNLFCMTRSNPSNLHVYDIKIDRTFHNADSDIVDFDLGNSDSYFDFGVDISPFSLENMANNDKTFK
ncbi:hypothetical protein CR513_08410, partial [Mucuna pruriens]